MYLLENISVQHLQNYKKSIEIYSSSLVVKYVVHDEGVAIIHHNLKNML